jgi:hypothetical protein
MHMDDVRNCVEAAINIGLKGHMHEARPIGTTFPILEEGQRGSDTGIRPVQIVALGKGQYSVPIDHRDWTVLVRPSADETTELVLE